MPCGTQRRAPLERDGQRDLHPVPRDLRTKDGASKFEASVTSFEKKHPEFRVARAAAKDPGGLKLNHYAHLQPNLIGPNHTRVQMICDDCHRVANVNDALPYPGAQLQPTSLSNIRAASSNSTASPRIDPRAYFATPEFVKALRRMPRARIRPALWHGTSTA